jgi:hypothetical protein
MGVSFLLRLSIPAVELVAVETGQLFHVPMLKVVRFHGAIEGDRSTLQYAAAWP